MKLKTLTAVLALSAFAIAGGSLAASAAQTTVNVKDGAGTALANNVTSFDWAEFGSGVAINVGPFGTPLDVGDNFDFLYQANLVNFGDQGTGLPGLVTTANGGTLGTNFGFKEYQFTVVARISETVSSITPDGLDADFATTGGTISIFYDDRDLAGGGTQANSATGTGFNDGKEIARFTVVPGGFSSFEVLTLDPDTGAGTAKLEFDISAALDFVDPAFLQGVLGAVMDLHFDSNLNYPPGTSATTGFHLGSNAFYPGHTVDGDDIVFKVDGSNTFSYKVPEPATLGLLGAGLVGVCFALRRRSSAAAA